MTSEPRLTLRTLVLGSASSRCDRTLAEVVKRRDHGGAVANALTRLSTLGHGLVCGEIGTVADRLLDDDVTDLVARGWERHRAILEARQWTAQFPDAEAVVPLATHANGYSYRPWVDVLVDETPVTRIELSIDLVATIDGAVVTVQGGAISRLRSGRLTVRGALSCEHVEVAERSTTFDLPGVLGPAPGPDRADLLPHPRTAESPPAGTIVGGMRFTDRDAWEPVKGYEPGDIVNGHRLNAQGPAWEPLGPRRPMR
jgi:hypothetical protein